jgi:hypothetical protein
VRLLLRTICSSSRLATSGRMLDVRFGGMSPLVSFLAPITFAGYTVREKWAPSDAKPVSWTTGRLKPHAASSVTETLHLSWLLLDLSPVRRKHNHAVPTYAVHHCFSNLAYYHRTLALHALHRYNFSRLHYSWHMDPQVRHNRTDTRMNLVSI